MSREQRILTVNGLRCDAWVEDHELLLEVLHDNLGLAEVRYGCGEGVCGTCTVLLDGEPVSSCLLLAVQAVGHRVDTASGLLGEGGSLHPLQEAFLRHGAAQCGFCTPGVLMTILALLERTHRPTRDEIRHQLVGNLCRCTGYTKILDAAEDYSGSINRDGGGVG
ncbi:MAG: (2Fe-2S)-binding protein [Actinomycetota bacterium]|nr:(2Fe-2S)-binding protein [Actinomycetota bacterium]